MSIIDAENGLIMDLFHDSERKDIKRCAETAHGQFILNLILTYFVERGVKDAQRWVQSYFITEGLRPQYQPFFTYEELPNLCEQLQIHYLNSDFKIKNGKVVRGVSKENMIASGAVYTQTPIVEYIVAETLKSNTISPNTHILDFACGTGRFYQELVRVFTESGVDAQTAVTNCIDANDINPVAVNITRLKACSFLDSLTEQNMRLVSEHVRCENAIMPNQQEIGLFASETETFLYDAIVSNPPYLVLKPSHKTSDELADDMRRQVEFYRKSKLYSYSVEGMLNLYQLSSERMLQMLKPNGELGVICPSTLFADQSATNLRKHLLLHNKVRHITYFPEKAELFENNVTQATNIFFLQKGGQTDDISIEANGKSFKVGLHLIQELFPKNMEIPLISDKDWIILKKLSKYPSLRTISTIRNKRGELDLTLNCQYITTKPTKHQLIRGKMITEKGIIRDNPEFVSDDFIYTKSAEYMKHDCDRIRLIGQNICNIDNRQRLRFAFCEPTDILGNSCNYLSADFDTLKKLNILLSSALLNWRFRLTSSNNHINNYELDELPIADLNQIEAGICFESQEELNKYVCNLYGLDNEETLYISEQ